MIKPLMFLSLILMLSCKAQKPLGTPIEGLELLESDGYGPGEEFEARTIKDQKTLNQFYTQINKTRKPGLSVPAIDFGRNLVLLIQLGTQQGEKTVLISQTGETETERFLAVEILDAPTTTKNREIPSRAIHQTFYLYTIPFTDKTLVFERIDR